MQLAAYLASHAGFLITFVNTHYNHTRILRSNPTHLPSDNGLNIRLVSVSDGLSDGDNRDNNVPLFVKIIEHIGPVLEDLIGRLNREGPPVTCIISDVTAVRTLDVARKFGIPRVAFWPPAVATHAFICHAADAASKRTFAEKGVPEPNETVCFPGLPPLPSSQLPWVVGSKEDSESIFSSICRNLEALRESEWILCNSVKELEAKTLDLLPEGFPRICPVGPILPIDFLQKNCAREDRISTGLWPEEYECLEWLDSHAPASVLYISMGSIATLTKQQLEELAYGLETTQQPFLWVVRPDLITETGAALPEGFLQRTGKRIRIVSWAPQLLVLSHRAVGGFLTHCGWNSTLESMSAAVPMLVWPQLVDQFLNAQLVVEEWKVGLALDVEGKGVVGRASVEEKVKQLMQGEEGEAVRGRAASIRELILGSRKEGGSSHTSLQGFVDWVRQQSKAYRVTP